MEELDREGPENIYIPAVSYLSCSGCKHFKHTMAKSGLNPIYVNNCTHPKIMDAETARYAGLFNGNLPSGFEIKTPDWCPVLKNKKLE